MFANLPFGFRVTSELPLPADQVWERVATLEGVNAELMPWVRMTVPKHVRGLRLSDAPIGMPLFRSWILVAGCLPVDRHRFVLKEVRDGYFLETSSSWLHVLWHHERALDPVAGGCRLTDHVGFRPRVIVLGRLVLPVVRWIFAHRHRRLESWARSPRR